MARCDLDAEFVSIGTSMIEEVFLETKIRDFIHNKWAYYG